MKLEIEPTDMVCVVDGIHCRLWTGTSSTGAKVHMLARMLAVDIEESQKAIRKFAEAMQAVTPPFEDMTVFHAKDIFPKYAPTCHRD